MHLFLSISLGILISFISLKLKLLSLKGAIATFILAWIIFYHGEFKWTAPILTFFIFSSLLSKARKRITPQVDSYFQKSDERDHVQVIANGGFPGILILIYQFAHSELLYIAYVSAIAAVCSDTWSTEIGTLFHFKTYNIINFLQVEPGISGGVSVIGFIGGILGSVIILVSASCWINKFEPMFIIAAAGILGSVFDSFLGATLQAKYKCSVCKRLVEKKNHCDKLTLHSKGFKWLNNDGVNFATSVFGGIISFVFMSLII